jgi:hypothetical protein
LSTQPAGNPVGPEKLIEPTALVDREHLARVARTTDVGYLRDDGPDPGVRRRRHQRESPGEARSPDARAPARVDLSLIREMGDRVLPVGELPRRVDLPAAAANAAA